MRFVLIIPPSPWLISDRDFPFLGGLYVASAASKVCHTEVCDLSGIPEEYWHIPVADVYGVTGTSPNFPQMQKIIARLKKRDPGCIIIVGGVHATLFPKHILEKTEADYVFAGEGERGIGDFLNGISPESIPGLNGRSFESSPVIVQDIDQFWPAREMIDYFDYVNIQIHSYISKSREGSIITSRGCPYACAFCASRKLNHGTVRYRNIDSIVGEIKYLQHRFDCQFFNFLDDTFALKKERVFEVCDAIAPLNINWICLTRVDKVSEEMFKAMSAAGCLSVTYGIESGSNEILKKMQKHTTKEQAFHAIDLAKSAGIKVRAQMIAGFPGETDETVEETAQFIREAKGVDAWGVHVFQPYPGTDVWCHPEKYGWIPFDGDYDFSMSHTIGKPEDRLTNDQKVDRWFKYLRGIAGECNVHSKKAVT